ncbi:hypothetical protein OF83DRAFT_358188 [Amylostereum chailletii]|nr:hypothetical protein OF83DRAFT_358188 [Amylostereum chailletii]
MYAHGYQRYQSHLWQRLLTWSKMHQTTVEEDIALDEIRLQSTKGWALPQAVWVACNLDKKQFVHEDAVRSLNDKEEGPFRARGRHLRYIPDFTLGFIVGVLVCWSVEDDSVQRGPWAGNRVALMPIEEMKGEWEDISANALERTLEFPPLNTQTNP